MDAQARSSLLSWGLLPATAVALATSVTMAYLGVRRAATTLAQGDAQRVLSSVESKLAALGHRPSEAELEAIRGSLATDGVSWLAIVDPSGVVASGQAARGAEAPLPRPGAVELRDGVARAMLLIVPPRAGEGHGPPPGLPPPRREGPRGPSAGPGGEPGPPRIVVELRPSTALALQTDATLSLMVGLAAATLFVLTAIAHHRAAQQRARAVAESERSKHLSSLGEMSAVLAHEINNPLASLKGHAQLLEEALAEGSKEREKAERIVREAQRIERLTTDLLAFVRSGTLHRQEVKLDSLVAEATEPFRARIDWRGRAESCVGSIDRDRILDAIQNIVRNAVQSAAEGQVEIDTRATPTHWSLRVRDRGPGIAPGQEQKIFEPFFTTRVRGTGLGLFISKRIVEAHGGTIAAANSPDGGATFEIAIPLASGKEERAHGSDLGRG